MNEGQGSLIVPDPNVAPVGAGSEADTQTSLSEEQSQRGEPGRWLLVGLIALLVTYPGAQWILNHGVETAATQRAPSSAFEAALQSSFEHYQARRYDKAVTYAKAALAINPGSPDAYNNLAVGYLGLRRYDEAIRAAAEAVRLRPDYQLAQNNLTWIQQEKAKATLPPVAPADARRAAELVSLALGHSQARRFKECLDTARQAARLDPGSAVAFNNIGFCAANLQRWDEAIKSTQEALRLDPTLQIAKNNLAWILQERVKAGAQRPK